MNEKNRSARAVARAVACAIAGAGTMLVPTVPALAQEAGGGLSPGTRHSGFAWSVDAGLGYTDNLNRTAAHAESDTIQRVGGTMNYGATGRRSGANLNGNFGWEDYSSRNTSSDIVGRFSGNAYFGLIPEVLIWSVSDSFGPTRRNALDTLTPENRENINTFSTGPQLNLPLGGSTYLSAQAMYGRTSYEDSPYDNDTKSGTLSLSRRLSLTSSISANASAQRYEYTNRLGNSDYDVQSYYLQFTAGGRRTQLAVSAGMNQLHDFGRSQSGTLLGLTLARQLSTRSRVTLSAAQQFSAAGDVFRNRGRDEAGGVDTALLLSTSSPFKSKSLGAGWSISGRRTGLGINVSVQDEEYTRAPQLDRRAWYGQAQLTRKLRPTLSGRLYLDGYKEDFQVLDRNQDEVRVGVGLGWQVARQISLALDAGHTRRKQALGGTGGENRAMLSIVYSGGTSPGGFPGRGLDPGGMDSVGGSSMGGIGR